MRASYARLQGPDPLRDKGSNHMRERVRESHAGLEIDNCCKGKSDYISARLSASVYNMLWGYCIYSRGTQNRRLSPLCHVRIHHTIAHKTRQTRREPFVKARLSNIHHKPPLHSAVYNGKCQHYCFGCFREFFCFLYFATIHIETFCKI